MLSSTAIADWVRARPKYVDPGERVLPDILERDAARRFERNRKAAAAHDAHCLFGLRRAHIVQQQRLRARSQGLFQSSQSPHLAGDHLARRSAVQGAGNHLGNPATQSDVIALDQNAIGKIKPMALPATATHRVFIQHPKTRYGLARVEHLGFGAGDCIHILPGGVAMPLMRCIKLRITRSQARMARALLRITATACPFLTRTPSNISGWLMTSKRLVFFLSSRHKISRKRGIQPSPQITQSCLARTVPEARNPGRRSWQW